VRAYPLRSGGADGTQNWAIGAPPTVTNRIAARARIRRSGVPRSGRGRAVRGDRQPFRAGAGRVGVKGGRPVGSGHPARPGAWRLPLSRHGRGRSRPCRPRAPCGPGRARGRRPRCAARPRRAGVLVQAGWHGHVQVPPHRRDLDMRHEPGDMHPAAGPLRASLQRRPVRAAADDQQLRARGQPRERLRQRAGIFVRRQPPRGDAR